MCRLIASCLPLYSLFNDAVSIETVYRLDQRSLTDGPRTTDENVGGPWRNLDIICNFYVYYTVSLYYYII
jgi:hypothetical protein